MSYKLLLAIPLMVMSNAGDLLAQETAGKSTGPVVTGTRVTQEELNNSTIGATIDFSAIKRTGKAPDCSKSLAVDLAPARNVVVDGKHLEGDAAIQAIVSMRKVKNLNCLDVNVSKGVKQNEIHWLGEKLTGEFSYTHYAYAK